MGHFVPRTSLQLDTSLMRQPSSQVGLLSERSLNLAPTPSSNYGLAQRSKCGPNMSASNTVLLNVVGRCLWSLHKHRLEPT